MFVALLGPVAAILASAVGRYLLEKGPPFIRKHGGVAFPWIAPITVIVAIILAVEIGVIDSNQSGDAAANDLSAAHATSASADMDGQVAFLTGRATERATFATAQATQGLVVVTVGVIATTIAGLIGTLGIRKDSALPEPQD